MNAQGEVSHFAETRAQYLWHFKTEGGAGVREFLKLVPMSLTTSGHVFADPPGPPGKPEVTDYDKDHVDLKWEPPKNDGGAPILKYIVEKKPKFGDWEKVCDLISLYC